MLALTLLAAAAAVADEPERGVFVLTSTNDPSANEVVVFKLDTAGTPSLSLVDMLPTEGKGGAGGTPEFCSSRAISEPWETTARTTSAGSCGIDDFIGIEGTIGLAPDCMKPDSVALTEDHLFVVGANCAESHAWPSGSVDGSVVALTDPSAAQIAVGKDWAAVTMTSGSLLQLPLRVGWGAQRVKCRRVRSRARRTIPRSEPRSGTMSWDSRRPTVPTASPS